MSTKSARVQETKGNRHKEKEARRKRQEDTEGQQSMDNHQKEIGCAKRVQLRQTKEGTAPKVLAKSLKLQRDE